MIIIFIVILIVNIAPINDYKNKTTFYLLSFDKTQTKIEAEQKAKMFKDNGYLTYIYHNNKYNIIGFCYPDKEGATSVITSVKEKLKNAEIIEIESSKLKSKVNRIISKEIRFKDSISFMRDMCYKLYDLCVDFNKNNKNFLDVYKELLSYKFRAESIINSMKNIDKNYDKIKEIIIQNFNVFISNISQTIDEIYKVENVQKNLNYLLINQVFLENDLRKNLNKV